MNFEKAELLARSILRKEIVDFKLNNKEKKDNSFESFYNKYINERVDNCEMFRRELNSSIIATKTVAKLMPIEAILGLSEKITTEKDLIFVAKAMQQISKELLEDLKEIK